LVPAVDSGYSWLKAQPPPARGSSLSEEKAANTRCNWAGAMIRPSLNGWNARPPPPPELKGGASWCSQRTSAERPGRAGNRSSGHQRGGFLANSYTRLAQILLELGDPNNAEGIRANS
jgi:hypothetical protein